MADILVKRATDYKNEHGGIALDKMAQKAAEIKLIVESL